MSDSSYFRRATTASFRGNGIAGRLTAVRVFTSRGHRGPGVSDPDVTAADETETPQYVELDDGFGCYVPENGTGGPPGSDPSTPRSSARTGLRTYARHVPRAARATARPSPGNTSTGIGC
jgi:hypothetical protein